MNLGGKTIPFSPLTLKVESFDHRSTLSRISAFKKCRILGQTTKKQNKKNMTWHCPHRLAKKIVRSNLIFSQSSENRHAKLAGLNFEMYLTLLYAWWNWHAIKIALFLSVFFFFSSDWTSFSFTLIWAKITCVKHITEECFRDDF